MPDKAQGQIWWAKWSSKWQLFSASLATRARASASSTHRRLDPSRLVITLRVMSFRNPQRMRPSFNPEPSATAASSDRAGYATGKRQQRLLDPLLAGE
jgi:hypothetical protein